MGGNTGTEKPVKRKQPACEFRCAPDGQDQVKAWGRVEPSLQEEQKEGCAVSAHVRSRDSRERGAGKERAGVPGLSRRYTAVNTGV